MHFETTKDSSLFGDSLRSAKFALGSELSIATDRATIQRGLLAPMTVVVENACFAWHLTQGCGLDALAGEGALGGSGAQ